MVFQALYKFNLMRKIFYSFLFLVCALVAFAVEPVAPVVMTSVDDARVIYNVEGYYETNTGKSAYFVIGSNLNIPKGTTGLYLWINSPVLSSYRFTSIVPGLIKSASGNYVYLSCTNTQFNSIDGTSIDVTGYCPETGQNETFHIAFLPSYQ